MEIRFPGRVCGMVFYFYLCSFMLSTLQGDRELGCNQRTTCTLMRCFGTHELAHVKGAVESKVE